jgi:hypothetical protein
MIESEYRLRFRLLTEENELNFLRLNGCRFDMNLREASRNQLIRFDTELEEKSQEMLQVRYFRQHPHNIWEMRERRAEHYVNFRMRYPVIATDVLKVCIYPPSNSVSAVDKL